MEKEMRLAKQILEDFCYAKRQRAFFQSYGGYVREWHSVTILSDLINAVNYRL